MNRKVDPRLLQPGIKFEVESIESVLSRYQELFGSDFMKELSSSKRRMVDMVTFLRDKDTNDVWAYCDNSEEPFGFQIDPDCRVIIIWRSDTEFIEIGDWSESPDKEAISAINDMLH